MGHGDKYTEAEILQIKQWGDQRIGIKAIAARTGRSPGAIKTTLHSMGIRVPRVSTLGRLYAQGITNQLEVYQYLWTNKFLPHLVKKNSGCWEWHRSQTKLGYGTYTILDFNGKNRKYYIHRISLCVHLGRLLGHDEDALHRCDNPRCSNPEHLFVGSQVDNVHDMVRKGRQRSGGAKLDEASVLAIRQEYEAGGVTQIELARRHGLHESTLRAIVRYKSWQHVGHRKENHLNP